MAAANAECKDPIEVPVPDLDAVRQLAVWCEEEHAVMNRHKEGRFTVALPHVEMGRLRVTVLCAAASLAHSLDYGRHNAVLCDNYDDVDAVLRVVRLIVAKEEHARGCEPPALVRQLPSSVEWTTSKGVKRSVSVGLCIKQTDENKRTSQAERAVVVVTPRVPRRVFKRVLEQFKDEPRVVMVKVGGSLPVHP